MSAPRPQANPPGIHAILIKIGCALARQAARDDDAAERQQEADAAGDRSCVAPSTRVSRPICRTRDQ